ncbi:MAG: hypothetical protein EBZ77_05575 [Chitinophagia bacterium]|nr:hypothetical protein [Chitinophagia bacterium]
MLNAYTQPDEGIGQSVFDAFFTRYGTVRHSSRVANERLNQVLEARLGATLIKDVVTAEGERYRDLFDLKLERDYSPLFALSLTVVHPITPDSPIHGMSEADLRNANAEILVSLSGMDETFSQQIHARRSYTADEMVWDRSFEDMLSRTEDGYLLVDLSKIDDLKRDPSSKMPLLINYPRFRTK